MHEHGAAKEAPVGRKLDADVSSILVSSMFQALRLGGSAGQPLIYASKLACLHACMPNGLIICMPCLHHGSAERHGSSVGNMLLLLAGVEAQLMVPRALTVLESSKSAQQAWLGAWDSTPLHGLLPWAAQMLSLLGSSEGAALLPALKVSTGTEIHECCSSPPTI